MAILGACAVVAHPGRLRWVRGLYGGPGRKRLRKDVFLFITNNAIVLISFIGQGAVSEIPRLSLFL